MSRAVSGGPARQTPSRHHGLSASSAPLSSGPRPLIDLSLDEYSAVLKDVLRDFGRPDRLMHSSLLRSRLLPAGAEPARLQRLLTETADALFKSPRDQRLRRVLDLGYFHPASKHEAAAERLGLAFSTYRRYLTAAIGRLARWLWESERAAAPRAPKLSVVVLPFVNLSPHDGQEYLVEGITENLTTDLSRIPGMVVISRDTAYAYKDGKVSVREIGSELAVHYVMEGSVQAERDRIRVNARLVEAESGVHLWAERIDKPRANLLDMQDEITAHLARTVDIELVAAESRRLMREHPNQLDSAELTLRARAIWNRPFCPEGNCEARRLFESALLTSEENLAALLGVVDTHMRDVTFHGAENAAEQIRSADFASARALTLAPESAAANFSRGTVLCALKAPESARDKFDFALARDPNLARAHAYRGLVEILLGRSEATEPHVTRAMRLSPRDPMYSAWGVIAAVADLYLGRIDAALSRLRHSVGINPNCGSAQTVLAVTLWLAGSHAQAALVGAEARRIVPGFTIAKFRNGAMSDNPVYLAQRERFMVALRHLGIPEA